MGCAGLATSWSLISIVAELVCGGPVRSGVVDRAPVVSSVEDREADGAPRHGVPVKAPRQFKSSVKMPRQLKSR